MKKDCAYCNRNNECAYKKMHPSYTKKCEECDKYVYMPEEDKICANCHHKTNECSVPNMIWCELKYNQYIRIHTCDDYFPNFFIRRKISK